MQYQLLGVGSGFFAHILAALLVCWRRTLKTGAVVGGMTVLAVEAAASALTHQFPPSVATHALAAALALALAYGVGATVFACELLRGALRALSLLQGEAAARTEAARLTAQSLTAQSLTAQSQRVGAWKSLVTPLPLLPATPPRPARAVRRQGMLAHSAPQVQTSLPLSDVRHHMRLPAGAMANPMSSPALAPQVFVPMFMPGGAAGGPGEPFHAFENDPTQPITICEEDSAMVMLLPENSLYVLRFVPKPPGAVAHARAFGPSQWVQASRMGALPPLTGIGVVASASPPLALYAPWSVVPLLEPVDPAMAPTEADAPRRGQRMAPLAGVAGVAGHGSPPASVRPRGITVGACSLHRHHATSGAESPEMGISAHR